MVYNFDMQINYGTNEQYRQSFRELCGMTNVLFDPSLNTQDLDEETLDEQHFDMAAASRTMDSIWEFTKGNVLFQRIYKKAAGIMLSQDQEIGLAIMISYDYLDVFHACLQEFNRDPVFFSENNVFYLAVIERFKKLGHNNRT